MGMGGQGIWGWVGQDNMDGGSRGVETGGHGDGADMGIGVTRG